MHNAHGDSSSPHSGPFDPRASTASHNRVRELASLEAVLDASRAQLFIMYGRRGVGKSALLAHAVRNIRHIYYRASRRTLTLQLQELAGTIREVFPDSFVPGTFGSTSQFLQFLRSYASEHPRENIVLVIDELPYLADVDAGLLTVIQHWWDANKHLANLKIFLSGSYVSFMEREVLSVNAPLYNRRTGAMRLEPLTYREAAQFFPGYSPRERLEVWAILGGLPSYLEQFDPDCSIDDNLLRTALRPNTYLNQEPEWLLLEDLRSDIIYGSILRAIAGGARKPSDIARAIGLRSGTDVARQLDTLRDLNLVVRQIPITDRRKSTSRRSLYWLADNYLTFWYRYVDPLGSLIVQGRGDTALERIKPSFHEFVSRPPWEEACRQFLLHAAASARLPKGLEFTDVGTWWNDANEIDIIALDGHETVLAGSCKWTNSVMTTADLHGLSRTVAAVAKDLHPRTDPWYALFSREGFDEPLRVLAQQDGSRILLFTLDEMFA